MNSKTFQEYFIGAACGGCGQRKKNGKLFCSACIKKFTLFEMLSLWLNKSEVNFHHKRDLLIQRGNDE